MSVHRAGLPIVVCLLAFLFLAPGAPTTRAEEPEDPAGLAALEKQIAEMAREVELLEKTVGVEKKLGQRTRAELSELSEYLAQHLGRVVGFPVDPRHSEFPRNTPDEGRIRSAIADAYRDLLKIDLIVPRGAYRDDEDGGLSSPHGEDRVRVRYLPGGVIPTRKSMSLMKVLVHLREVTKQMETDIRNLVTAWAELESRTSVEIRELKEQLQVSRKKVEHRDGLIAKLEAEKKKLEAAIELLKGDK